MEILIMDLGIWPPSTQSRLEALRERARTALRAAAGRSAAARWAATPALAALGIRLLVFLVADLGARLLPAGPFPGILRAWQHKDADWYLSIAQHGYLYSTASQSSVNFFPLYPLLIWIVEPFAKLFTRSDAYLAAGLAVSWVAFLGACIVLYKLVLDRFDQGAAYLSVLLLATFPFSLFYGAPYTESVFLLLTVSAFLAAEKRRWWLAGLLCLLDGATRPPGLIVGGCIIVAYLLDWHATRHRLRADVLALALVPLGTAAYVAYCWWLVGDPLAYSRASWVGWHGGQLQLGGIAVALRILLHPQTWLLQGDPLATIAGTYALALVACCLLAIPVWRALGAPYALFTLASVLVPLVTYPNINSMGRYASVAFPAFIVVALALRSRPALRDAVLLVFTCLLAIVAVYFVTGRNLS